MRCEVSHRPKPSSSLRLPRQLPGTVQVALQIIAYCRHP
ncbi:hypothetical protein T1E_2076 [Pseudomonas putida DOT-T1E]|uniref:Uncharacterized protein n=1 Tax=Pseudomonas putida (strain DOT-T1E) TaxID=1196325 RepID=I7C860_PSEPT|nr:hypothetical protein T1E_2076 [Pseudomonas putida DOT-T1E]